MKRILDATGKTEDEIKTLIEAKKKELPEVSEEGVHRLVGKELGVDLSKPQAQELKIASIVPNMRNISFHARLVDMSPVREFNNDRGPGKVMNVTLEDDSGRIRMSLWNDEIDKFTFSVGDVIKIDNCVTRKDNLDNPEVRLGFAGSVLKSDKNVGERAMINKLIDAKFNDEVLIEARLIEVFNRPLIYDFCPECRSRLTGDQCTTHGTVTPEKVLIMSGILDDGTKSIGTVFFRENAEKVLGVDVGAVENETSTKGIEGFLNDQNFITKKLKIQGNITKNRVNGEEELRVKNVEVL